MEMQEYVLEISAVHKDALAVIRLMNGVQVAEDGHALWLRGIPFSSELSKDIWQLPYTNIYTLNHQNYLFPLGGQVPVAKLPALNWASIKNLVKIEPPVSAIKGEPNQRVKVKLVPSIGQQAGSALLTTLPHWKMYAETAPLVRLRRISFAVSGTNQVLLMGNPLPPVPGKEYWMRNGLLLPCGYDFEFPVVAALLPELLSLEGKDLAIFDADGSWQKVKAENFVITTRSAVRMTTGANLN